MSIVTSTIQILQGASQRKRVVETHTDHLDVNHIYEYYTTSPFDPEQELAVHATQVAQMLGIAEAESLIPNLGTIDFSTITLNHISKQNAIKYLLRWGMKQTEPDEAVKILPMITWLKANYTGQQLADYIGVTLAQLQTVNDRYTALENIEATMAADPGYATDLDA